MKTKYIAARLIVASGAAGAVGAFLSTSDRIAKSDLFMSMQYPARSFHDTEVINRASPDRRGFFIQIVTTMLSPLLLPLPSSAVNGKTIVVTGCNSGIGFEACKRLSSTGDVTIIMACRSLAKAEDAVARILSETSVIGTLIPAECDLASIQSIQSFAKNISVEQIDTLCLNAGIARSTEAKDCARTENGFEQTVGINHFGHVLLNSLLLPKMAKDGQIVVTASSVHDPESPGGSRGVPATLGDLRGLAELGKNCEMIDGGDFNADKAYKDSKLCNVLFTRELQRRLTADERTNGISVNCFSPGLIVGTGLFRDQNPFFVKVFGVLATNILRVGETPEWGGACLAYMTTRKSKGLFYDSPPGSSKYGDGAFGKQFVPSNSSRDSQDDAKAQKLWELSYKVLSEPA